MKIVAQVDKDYLCRISETEIALITGFGNYANYGNEDKKKAWFKATGRTTFGTIPADTEIAITRGYSYMRQLNENEAKVTTCAGILRQLADMIETSLPSIIIKPETSIEEPH